MNSKQTKSNNPIYNSRIINSYIRLIKKDYSYINIQELLDFAEMTPYEVADEGHWFTQEQVNRFHDKLSKLTNNENIAREAGRLSASSESVGTMRQYVLGMVSPAQAYTLIGKSANKITKSTNYEIQKLSSNKVEIKVTPREGVQEQPFQCESRCGFFDAISIGFTNKLPQIEHPECVFRGGIRVAILYPGKINFRIFGKRHEILRFYFL